MLRKFLIGEPVKIARPFGHPFLRGEIGIVSSMPRPAIYAEGQGNAMLVTEYAIEVDDRFVWINESALDKMEYKKCA